MVPLSPEHQPALGRSLRVEIVSLNDWIQNQLFETLFLPNY